jgi:hypothetical protein
MALTGKTHADAFKRRPLTAETRAQYQSVTCWIFGRQSGTNTGFFLRERRFSRVIIISSVIFITVLI